MLIFKSAKPEYGGEDIYIADEMFTTVSMGALSWVNQVDGRVIRNGEKGTLTTQLQTLYSKAVETERCLLGNHL